MGGPLLQLEEEVSVTPGIATRRLLASFPRPTRSVGFIPRHPSLPSLLLTPSPSSINQISCPYFFSIPSQKLARTSTQNRLSISNPSFHNVQLSRAAQGHWHRKLFYPAPSSPAGGEFDPSLPCTRRGGTQNPRCSDEQLPFTHSPGLGGRGRGRRNIGPAFAKES